MNEYEMPFDKKYKDVAKVLYSIRKLQEEQVIQLQEENKKLQQELDQYKNNWGELKGWLTANTEYFVEAIPFKETLRKMKELEGDK